MLSCKQFLQELNEFLEETLEPEFLAELQQHVKECPNCWVLCNTTEKTIKVYKGCQPKAIPSDIEKRFWAAIQKRIEERGPLCGEASEKTHPNCPETEKI